MPSSWSLAHLQYCHRLVFTDNQTRITISGHILWDSTPPQVLVRMTKKVHTAP